MPKFKQDAVLLILRMPRFCLGVAFFFYYAGSCLLLGVCRAVVKSEFKLVLIGLIRDFVDQAESVILRKDVFFDNLAVLISLLWVLLHLTFFIDAVP